MPARAGVRLPHDIRRHCMSAATINPVNSHLTTSQWTRQRLIRSLVHQQPFRSLRGTLRMSFYSLNTSSARYSQSPRANRRRSKNTHRTVSTGVHEWILFRQHIPSRTIRTGADGQPRRRRRQSPRNVIHPRPHPERRPPPFPASAETTDRTGCIAVYRRRRGTAGFHGALAWRSYSNSLRRADASMCPCTTCSAYRPSFQSSIISS